MNAPPPPHQGAKLRSIEAARGIAALMVASMHAANLMNTPQFSGHIGMWGFFDFGYVGVDFFFVLSGFIITYVHYRDLDQPQRIPIYLWRRFSRIYPIYWAILLFAIVTTTLGRIISGKSAIIDIELSDISGTLLLLISPGEPKYIGVAWTLQFEVLFYAAFTLLLVQRRLGCTLFLAWGCIVVGNALQWTDILLPMHLGNAHCFEFLLGVATGALLRNVHFPLSRYWILAAIVLFAGATAFEAFGPLPRHSPQGRLVMGIVSALMLIAIIGTERQRPLRTPAWLATLGTCSYSIYLAHILLLSLTYSLMAKLGWYQRLPEYIVYGTGLSIALVVTLLIGLKVELPLVATLKGFKFTGRQSSSSIPPP